MVKYLESRVALCVRFVFFIKLRRSVHGEERSLGTKISVLDYLKRWSLPARANTRDQSDSTSSEIESSSSNSSKGSSTTTNSKAIQRPGLKTLDSYVIRKESW